MFSIDLGKSNGSDIEKSEGGHLATSLRVPLPETEMSTKELVMDKQSLLGLAAAIGLVATGNAAQAANCASRDALVSSLESQYSEQLTARGLQSSKTLIEFFASAETGTFTVLVTNAQGVSCIVGAGTEWHLERPDPKVAGIAG